jgi:hypothetical protein
MAKAPVKKKAPAKKAVAKKKAVVKKPVKKSVAKKKAPVKKAAAKKAVAKKTVAKKAVVKKAATKKKAPAKKAVTKKAATKKRAVAPKAVSYAPTNEWLTKEPELPVFLQTQAPVMRKLPIATQEYGNNKKQSPRFVLAALVVLLAISGGSAYFLSNDKSVDVKATDVSVVKDSKSEGDSSKDSGSKNSQTEETATPAPTTSSTAKPSKSANNSANESSSPKPTKNPENEVSVQSPRTFSSVQVDQGATLKWLAPKNLGRVVAFELYAKEDGQSSWTLISTVTTEQLEFDIELTPTESNSQFRVASLLSTNKKVFNPTTLTLPGSLT